MNTQILGPILDLLCTNNGFYTYLLDILIPDFAIPWICIGYVSVLHCCPRVTQGMENMMPCDKHFNLYMNLDNISFSVS